MPIKLLALGQGGGRGWVFLQGVFCRGAEVPISILWAWGFSDSKIYLAMQSTWESAKVSHERVFALLTRKIHS